MAKAVWNGAVVAESDETIIVEGNHYFPRDAITAGYYSDNSKTTYCGWKGTARYFDLEVDGQRNAAAAWYYPEPLEKAANIKDYVAFWNGVEVSA